MEAQSTLQYKCQYSKNKIMRMRMKMKIKTIQKDRLERVVNQIQQKKIKVRKPACRVRKAEVKRKTMK